MVVVVVVAVRAWATAAIPRVTPACVRRSAWKPPSAGRSMNLADRPNLGSRIADLDPDATWLGFAALLLS